MPLAHFRVSHHRVGTSGSASAVVQYRTREGAFAPEKNPGKWDDLRHVETANLPAWAQGDAQGYFARAEQHERANGRWATSWSLALPRELSEAEQMTMARAFIGVHLDDKPTLWVVHSPMASDGQPQPHIHVLFSERRRDGIDRGGPAQEFRRWNANHPERGGAQKDAWFSQRASVWAIRASWCDWTNTTLEHTGSLARIHPESCYRQGSERKPEPMARAVPAHVVEEVRNTRDRDEEQTRASWAWDARKVVLGMTATDTPAMVLRASHAWARAQGQGTWSAGAGTAQEQRVDIQARKDATRERRLTGLATRRHLLEHRLSSIHLPQTRSSQQVGVGNGLRARIEDKEWREERGTGYGR